jgi:hypothetical protein
MAPNSLVGSTSSIWKCMTRATASRTTANMSATVSAAVAPSASAAQAAERFSSFSNGSLRVARACP